MIQGKPVNMKFNLDEAEGFFEADNSGYVSRPGGAPLSEEDIIALLETGLWKRVKVEKGKKGEKPDSLPAPEPEPEEEDYSDVDTGEFPAVLDVDSVVSRVNDFTKAAVADALEHFNLEYKSNDRKDNLVQTLAAHLTTQELLDEAFGVLEED